MEGRPLRFGAYDGLSTVGGGVRKAGFKGSGGVWLSFSDFYKMAACFKSGVTLKGLGGVVTNLRKTLLPNIDRSSAAITLF